MSTCVRGSAWCSKASPHHRAGPEGYRLCFNAVFELLAHTCIACVRQRAGAPSVPVLVGELRCDSPRGEQVQARLPRLLSVLQPDVWC